MHAFPSLHSTVFISVAFLACPDVDQRVISRQLVTISIIRNLENYTLDLLCVFKDERAGAQSQMSMCPAAPQTRAETEL